MPYKRAEVIDELACSFAIRAVLTRAVEVEPEKRYADAREFCEALRSAAMQTHSGTQEGSGRATCTSDEDTTVAFRSIPGTPERGRPPRLWTHVQSASRRASAYAC